MNLDLNDYNIIPAFDGNTNKLDRFIKVAESLLTHYSENLKSFQNIKIINGIIMELTDEAEVAVLIRKS